MRDLEGATMNRARDLDGATINRACNLNGATMKVGRRDDEDGCAAGVAMKMGMPRVQQ